MAKQIDGTFVIKAKLSHSKQVVYCAGIASNKHVIWTEDVNKAIRISGCCKSDLDQYASDIYSYNERYNEPGKDYAVSLSKFDIAKRSCNYMVLFGTVNTKSESLGVFTSTTLAARHIASHAKVTYPKDRYLLYKHKAKFTDRFYPYQYSLIDKTTGQYSKSYYYIMEVPK